MDADRLVEIGTSEAVELFHANGEPFASFRNGPAVETVRLNSSRAKSLLSAAFFRSEGGAARTQSLDEALAHLGALALHERAERAVAIRVGHAEDAVFLDLADGSGDVVRIVSGEWRIEAERGCPIRFLRPDGTLPLPRPKRSESIDALRDLVNLRCDEAWILGRAWLLATLSKGPYPLLILGGSQDSGKSSTSRLLRSTIDPRAPSLRSPPKEEEALYIAAKRTHVLAFDNTSGIPHAFSDALCRLSYGEGLSKRKLYTDDEESTFKGARPVLLNGIDDAAVRPDLRDRSIVLWLPPLDDRKRRTEEELREEFALAHAGILGGLLDVAAVAMRNYRTVTLERAPRMADFARWNVAADHAWPSLQGRFESTYADARNGDAQSAIESCPVAVEIVALVDERPEGWTGTPTELLRLLNDRRSGVSADRDWPSSAKDLANKIRRIAPALTARGVLVELPERAKGRQHRREFFFRRSTTAHDAHHAHHASEPSST
jgi:hypothetical protein